MKFDKLVTARRTVRKYNGEPVAEEQLEQLVDYARLAPYGANMQPLKFRLVTDRAEAGKVFEYIKWSGYHPEDGPKENEQPPAYIAILADTDIKSGSCDVELGTAGAYIVLGAADMGLATCWLGAIDKEKIGRVLRLAPNLKVLNLIAVGHSSQKSSVEDIKDGDVRYSSDENGDLHVPKRTLEEILV